MLRDVRERKGITVKELSNMSGVSCLTIYKIEKGYMPKKVTLGKLARVLQVEIEEIER